MHSEACQMLIDMPRVKAFISIAVNRQDGDCLTIDFNRTTCCTPKRGSKQLH